MIGVDRASLVLRGVVVAQAGRFRDRTGYFDNLCLRKIARLIAKCCAKSSGVISNDGHDSYRFLGWVRNPWIDAHCVRADLHLDPASLKPSRGSFGLTILNQAASSPDTLAASVVISYKTIPAIDDRGPKWLPTVMKSCDIVTKGRATDGLFGPPLPRDEWRRIYTHRKER